MASIKASFFWLVLFTPLFFTGCSATPEIKTLSTHQMDYFDTAIVAITEQSKALILASEAVAQNAEAAIDAKAAKNHERMSKLITLIPTLPPEKQEATTQRLLSEISETSREAERAKLRLNEDIKTIREKSEELTDYLKKMKDIQLAIDAYVQSEQAGNRVVSHVLQHPTLADLLAKSQALIPKIQAGSEALQHAITNIKGVQS